MTTERQIELTALAKRVCELVPSGWGWQLREYLDKGHPIIRNRLTGILFEICVHGPSLPILRLMLDLAKRTGRWVAVGDDDKTVCVSTSKYSSDSPVTSFAEDWKSGETLAENVCLAYVHYLGAKE
jgi:hypothetical protein